MSGSADSETSGTFSVCILLFKGSLIKALGQMVSDVQSITVDKVILRFHCRFLTDYSVVLFRLCRACWNLQLCDNPQKTCSMSTSTKHNHRKYKEYKEANAKLQQSSCSSILRTVINLHKHVGCITTFMALFFIILCVWFIFSFTEDLKKILQFNLVFDLMQCGI